MNNSPIMSSKQIAIKVSIGTIVINLILSALKLFAGIFAHSGAMISDAIHSASDVVSTIIVIVGVNISAKDADEKHPYGHERFECIASIVLAVVLAITGLSIGKTGVDSIISGDYVNNAMPGILALIAAIASIATKEGMFWYTRKAAKETNSGALMADAWHHRSDALSSIGAFIGILGARIGFPIADSLASLVICVFIVKAAWDIVNDAIKKMIDYAGPEEATKEIMKTVENIDGIHHIDLIKTRLFGSKIYVDLEIAVDGRITVREAHDIAHLAHDAVERNISGVKHCMVHVNPAE